MNAIAVIMTVFSVAGALDRIFGNKLGLGKEFEKGLGLFGPLALSMIGLISLSPLIADALEPFMGFVWNTLHIDPSLVTSLLFANDMGGATLANEIAKDPQIARFNGLVIASMMGCTVSFTIPYALEKVKPAQREWLLLGLLCGIVTIPVGCLIAGFILMLPIQQLLLDLLPLLLISLLIGFALLRFPKACTRVFGWLGVGIKALITAGLALSIIEYLTGYTVLEGMMPLEEAASFTINCVIVLTGAFPLMFVLSKLLRVPLNRLGKKIGINEPATMGLVSSLAASMTTFEAMENMDDKGAMLNAAFAVSAAFVLADHLACTLAFDPSCLPAVMIGKLTAGVCALFAANVIYKFMQKR